MERKHEFNVVIIAEEKEVVNSSMPVIQCDIAGKTVLEHVVEAARLSGASNIAVIHKSIDELPDGFLNGGCGTAVIYGNMPLIKPEVVKELAVSAVEAENILNTVSANIYANNDDEQFFTVNTKVDLAKAAGVIRKRINERHMLQGVTIIDPDQTYINSGVKIGADTVVYPNVIIEGNTVIGGNCVIGPNSRLTDMIIGNYVKIESSTLTNSKIGDYTVVGPYAYVRPNCEIGEHVKVGDFVEIKNSVIGDNTKMSHLTYVGDSDIGKGINFGCGVVIVNYDGKNKFRAKVEDNAFIGCNCNLIAPVTVGQGAYIAAGSTITDDVPEKSFAIARARQIIKTAWKDKRG